MPLASVEVKFILFSEKLEQKTARWRETKTDRKSTTAKLLLSVPGKRTVGFRGKWWSQFHSNEEVPPSFARSVHTNRKA